MVTCSTSYSGEPKKILFFCMVYMVCGGHIIHEKDKSAKCQFYLVRCGGSNSVYTRRVQANR